MSAIREEGADAEPIRVLFTLHHNMNALDFVGPLEVMSSALHNVNDEGESLFSYTYMSASEQQRSCWQSSCHTTLHIRCTHPWSPQATTTCHYPSPLC